MITRGTLHKDRRYINIVYGALIMNYYQNLAYIPFVLP